MPFVEKLPQYLIFALCCYAIIDLAKYSDAWFANPDAVWLQVVRGGVVGGAFVWVGQRLQVFGWRG
ncbi:MAG: hypothetical protein AAFY42_14410 [Pseudomonadota bacterium]